MTGGVLMSKLIASLLAALALTGCVAVPYEPAPVAYYPPYYGPYYAPYYAGPAVSLNYSYHRYRR